MLKLIITPAFLTRFLWNDVLGCRYFLITNPEAKVDSSMIFNFYLQLETGNPLSKGRKGEDQPKKSCCQPWIVHLFLSTSSLEDSKNVKVQLENIYEGRYAILEYSVC